MKLKPYLLIGFMAVSSLISTRLFAQCAAFAFTSSDGNCISLIWNITNKPSPVPTSLSFNGDDFSFYTGAGDIAFPAIYKKNSAQDCLIPSDYLSGYVTINYASEPITCAYGVLLALQDLSFSATANQSRNTLQWSLKEDQNSGMYDVERSQDGEQFTKIKTIAAKSNGETKTAYEYRDELPFPVAYYRLKITDKSGASFYSKIVKVENNNIKTGLTVYPNPNKGSFTITGISAKELNSLSIVDVQGRKVAFKATGNNGNQSALVAVKGNTSGVFFVQYISATAGKVTTRFVVQ